MVLLTALTLAATVLAESAPATSMVVVLPLAVSTMSLPSTVLFAPAVCAAASAARVGPAEA